MSRASHLTLVTAPDTAPSAAWLATLGSEYVAADVALLQRTLEWLTPQLHDLRAKGGEPALDHALNVATLLRDLKLDAE